MDFSDQIRRQQTKAIWAYQKQVLAAQATCNYSTCTSSLTAAGCKVNYETYEYKYQTVEGKKNCTCTTSAVCGCGS